jgi:hypothetical protein
MFKMNREIKKRIAQCSVGLQTALGIFLLYSYPVMAAETNTSAIDGFIDFACDWLKKIGAVIALVGGVMFALGWQRDDAEGKSRALMTMMAGFMLAAVATTPSLFGL